jgi:sugar phosphate isomerase/epimerase
VLSDDNAADPIRAQHAGRVGPALMLDEARWRVFADGVNRIARAVAAQTGLRVVFHHHCAGFVETPTEIERLLALTDPGAVGLVFDTGHYAFGSGNPSAAEVMRGYKRSGRAYGMCISKTAHHKSLLAPRAMNGTITPPCGMSCFANWAKVVYPSTR